MSHCTSFPFAYTEERHLVSALDKMKLSAEYTVVNEYSNHLAKSLSYVGYMGGNQYRALCAKHEAGNIMILKEKDAYRFSIESSKGPVAYGIASDIEVCFRLFYIESVLEEICDDYRRRGVTARLSSDDNSFSIHLGSDMSISVSISVKGGLVHEEVNGVSGSVCEIITAQIEAMLAAPNSTLTSEWKTAYHEEIDNKIVEVLDLHQ